MKLDMSEDAMIMRIANRHAHKDSPARSIAEAAEPDRPWELRDPVERVQIAATIYHHWDTMERWLNFLRSE